MFSVTWFTVEESDTQDLLYMYHLRCHSVIKVAVDTHNDKAMESTTHNNNAENLCENLEICNYKYQLFTF